MNHTIKGIIIVAAIASMLVLGATTIIPIIQNSFARSTNTNTNTNSADSSSSSTATADNTNNIDNTATASNSQNQTACAVALTCPEGSTTVTPPATGTLIITKICQGGTSSCEQMFSITVTDNNPQPSSLTLSNGQHQDVRLGPGSFTVTESPMRFFDIIFSGDCKQSPTTFGEATGTIRAGQTLHCTITNQGVL